MDALLGRSRRRKSDVAPIVGVAPSPLPESPAAARRASRVKPVNWAQRNSIQENGEVPSSAPASARRPTVTFPPVVHPAGRRLNSFAQSIISNNRQQRAEHAPPRESRRSDGDDGDDDDDDDESDDRGRVTTNQEGDAAAAPVHDPWSQVLGKVMRKTSVRAGHVPVGGTVGAVGPASPESKRMSFTQVLKSREVKDLVKQAIVTNHWSEKASAHARAGSHESGQRSSVMEHWVKTAVLRHANPLMLAGNDDDDGLDGEEISEDGIKSGFDLRDTPTGSMYGRTLLLEESCRRAFAQSGENRTQMDLQALKAWFQMTKLKITTDFERLQPAELDLLCRRMVLVHLHANEIVFRQGDEGDAMYILFAGCVEVKVAQRILGEKVEVTVCELSKGDYFGERALLHDDPRAATIVAKTPCELVRITRKDYNIMLKQDQQEFFSRMQLAGSVHSSSTAPTITSMKPSLLLPRSRSTLQQQTQLEYINVLSKKKHARTKADIDMLSEYLHTLKFFRGLPKTFVRELCLVVDFLTVPPSSYVFREGEVGDQFYIIFSGSVDVIVSSKDIRGNTQQTKLINLTEGAHFGELALMKGHGIRSATVLTREETKFLVICEKDYNSTLRRMQKEDLAKRVGVLDRIPMFQTPEWTGELLKEMSYVLSEQKLATGAVLFRQGEKAVQVYFVVRGELLVTKEIVDPVSSQTHTVFVERIGRDRVVGDDAAAGVNFNEVIYREITVTAGTPVELLVLSKYDVFHRLSRAARETLRAAAHTHVESVVYLDRFHKTTKWDAYKQKLLKENLNHERMRKLLPGVDLDSSHSKPKPKPRATPRSKVKTETEGAPDTVAVPRKSSDSPTLRKPSAPLPISEILEGAVIDENRENTKSDEGIVDAKQSQLVDANEFLLLDPPTTALDNAFPTTERTLADHVTAFNADAPPRGQSRERQLKSALTIERRRQVEMLNEGNPLVYFDLDSIQAQQRQQQAEMRGRAASSRRLLLRKRESPATGATVAHSSSVKGGSDKHSLGATDTTSRNAMNQFFQDNFIFSHPKKPVETRRDRRQRRLLRRDLEQRHGLDSHDNYDSNAEASMRKRKNAADVTLATTETDAHVSEIEAARKAAEQLCVGDFVVVDVQQMEVDREVQASSGSPAFRIVRCCESLEAAAKLGTIHSSPQSRAHRLGSASSDEDDDGDDLDASALFVVQKRKFALMPRATRPRVAEEAQQHAVVGRFLRTNQTHTMDPMGLFASYQKLATTATEQSDAAGASTSQQDGKQSSYSPRIFASVSIVLSKRELETAFCEEPLLCVHALYPSEAEAMESALLMPPQALKNALLCILPVDEWLHFDEAYDWCVQIETDRRDKQPPPPSTGLASSSPSSVSPSRRKTGSICGLPGTSGEAAFGLSNGPPRANWEVEKEKAQRLHHFICTRMGLNKSHERDRRGGGAASGGDTVPTTGFTPRPTVTLEDKLATLQDYLDTTSQASLGGKNAGVHVSILGKYRQMKRFGSIMRSRISAVSPSTGTTGLTGVVPGGG